MNTLDLIRRLYDEDKSLEELAEGLDEETRAELERLVEAKEAMESLPPRRPSKAALDAVTAFAGGRKPERRPRMALLLGSRFVQRFAAAAAVVVAVGVGYLTLRTPQPAPEAERDVVTGQMAPESEAPAPAAEPAPRPNLADGAEEAPSRRAPEESAEARGDDEVLAMDAPALWRTDDSVDGDKVGNAGARALAGRTPVAKAAGEDEIDDSILWTDEIGSPMLWEEERELQTFYWKVQALTKRSPDDEWEEAVPLEGSFQMIEGASRDEAWREANTEQ